MGIPGQVALGAVFVSGLAFLILTAVGIRQLILAAIPFELYAALAAGHPHPGELYRKRHGVAVGGRSGMAAVVTGAGLSWLCPSRPWWARHRRGGLEGPGGFHFGLPRPPHFNTNFICLSHIP
jgi:hypothetical protein